MLHADPMLLSLAGSTNPASCTLLRSSRAACGVCACYGDLGGSFSRLAGKNLSVHHCGKNVFCFLKAVFRCSPGKAECEGLSTSMSADVTALFLLWRNVAVGRARVWTKKKWGWGRGCGCFPFIQPSCQMLLPRLTFKSNALLPWSSMELTGLS